MSKWIKYDKKLLSLLDNKITSKKKLQYKRQKNKNIVLNMNKYPGFYYVI